MIARLAGLLPLLIAATGAWPAHASEVRASVSAPCSAGLTLLLRPGSVPGNVNRTALPAHDMPAGPVMVHLPLYPAASRITSTFPAAGFQVLPPAYRKVAIASFALPGALNRVSSWYRIAFSTCGYQADGEMPLQQHGGPPFAGLSFASHVGVRWVALTFRPISSHLTLVQYVAQTLDLPPRPAASFLHGPFVRVSVLYRSAGAAQTMDHTYRFTITWPATIARLVTVVNQPAQIWPGPLGGGGSVVMTESTVLSFVRTHGGARRVKVGGEFNTLVVGHTRPLDDTNVERLVDRIVTLRCRGSHACG